VPCFFLQTLALQEALQVLHAVEAYEEVERSLLVTECRPPLSLGCQGGEGEAIWPCSVQAAPWSVSVNELNAKC
jgi:hypothetical protein